MKKENLAGHPAESNTTELMEVSVLLWLDGETGGFYLVEEVCVSLVVSHGFTETSSTVKVIPVWTGKCWTDYWSACAVWSSYLTVNFPLLFFL